MQRRMAKLASACAALSVAGFVAAQDAGLPSPDALLGAEEDFVALESVRVNAIAVQGSTVLSEAEIRSITAPYTNRQLTFQELQTLRNALSVAYVDRGYVNSGVLIPDQNIEGGVIVLQVVEGGLTEIDVKGNNRFSERAVLRRIRHGLSDPLDVNDLQFSLRSLQDDPLIARVNAELLPGALPGESYLDLELTESPPFEFVFGADNYRPSSVGEEQGTIGFTFRGLAGNGDYLSAAAGLTDGANDYSLTYAVPLTPGGIQLRLSATDQESDIVEEPFDAIDIASRLESWGVTALVPFARNASRSLTAIFGFEHRRSASTLLGLPFSFSPGDIDGRARGSATVLGVEWTSRNARQAFALRGQFEIGDDAFDASIDRGGTDSRFTLFRTQLQYLRNIAWRDSRLSVRASTQTTNDSLLAMFKLPVGGRYTVRGYRENQLVRDFAVLSSVEYQFPLLTDDVGRSRDSLWLAGFADYGMSWDEDASLVTHRREKIYSAGIGLLWMPVEGFTSEIYWGADLADIDNNGDSLQDDGVHYRIGYRKSF